MIGRNEIIGLIVSLALAAGAAAQTVREKPLDDLPAVDRGAAPPARAATTPPPPPVPKAPRASTRSAPPPADTGTDDDAAPPARETPPATRGPSRSYDPPPPPPRRAEPRTANPDAGDPPRRVDRTRAAAPPARSAFAANCTPQCHLACEASFEACNGDDSPAKPDCVRKLESCRVQRCSCRMN